MIDSKMPLQRAGGRRVVAESTGLTVSAVEKWPRLGYPEQYWSTLVVNSYDHPDGAILISDLHTINNEIRRRRTEIVSGINGLSGD